MSKSDDLKSTINLPKTSFKMKASLPVKEPEILGWWDKIDVYGRIRDARNGKPPFVLHDGPPYANGNIHLGQGLNKILKDIVVKSRSMMGHDAVYVPGWDCHGLPIEIHVDRELGAKKANLGPLVIRKLCRARAEKYIRIQSDDFYRIGVFWDRKLDAEEQKANLPSRKAIYRTIDHTYEAEIVRQLGRFFERDGVYHGVKPVHWCWSCTTALAEAEVEYADRTDPSIYVHFPLRIGADAADRVPALAGRDVSVLIWTTTPWTIPANLAVALHPMLRYVAVEVAELGGRVVIVAEGLLEDVSGKLGWQAPTTVATFAGAELVGEGDDWVGRKIAVERPYHAPNGDAAGDGVLVLGNYVTLDAGTGCVHTAPGHGADDFNTGQRYGLETYNPVGDDGRYVASRVGADWLAGEFVYDANKKIVADLEARGLLVHVEDYPHSYPHCWRCKNAVLFRSTPQWFIAMDKNDLRGKTLAQIRKTHWIPSFGENRIAQMIETRPDWCISRQRTWGVPIPVVVCAPCLENDPRAFVRDPGLFEHIAALFGTEGSNAWFGQPDGEGGHKPYDDDAQRLARLVPEGIACPTCGKREGLAIDDHIVDVWFESGVSHSAVLGRDARVPWPSDVYLEGHDQYRGWFHSSILTAVNDREQAPYREVVTHGFTLDGKGHKMSKSLGNVVSPQDIAKERGAEILRLWVAGVDFLEDMRMSEENLIRNAETYRKIRNTFRYMLGNLHGFDPASDLVDESALEPIDRWALEALDTVRARLVDAYAKHHYHVVYHSLHNFCAVTLSSFYFDILKDRLYTFPTQSTARRSAQTVLYKLAVDLCKLMAPVLCFTAEQIWQELEALNGREKWVDASVHTACFPVARAARDADLAARWEKLQGLREEVNKALEEARNRKDIGTALEARVVLSGPRETLDFLRSFGDDLRFLLLTSGVEFDDAGADALAVRVERAAGDKCQRCWHFTADVGADDEWPTVCARCARHVRQAATA